MAAAPAHSVIRNVIADIGEQCASKGVNVDQSLIGFVVRQCDVMLCFVLCFFECGVAVKVESAAV
eukprot:m.350692 g.350692  ORF g.350692 m.350692 type:complete len:65 (+) comp19891_c0_seq2:57-251(+)